VNMLQTIYMHAHPHTWHAFIYPRIHVQIQLYKQQDIYSLNPLNFDLCYLAMSTISQSHLSSLTMDNRGKTSKTNIKPIEEEGGEHVDSEKEYCSLS